MDPIGESTLIHAGLETDPNVDLEIGEKRMGEWLDKTFFFQATHPGSPGGTVGLVANVAADAGNLWKHRVASIHTDEWDWQFFWADFYGSYGMPPPRKPYGIVLLFTYIWLFFSLMVNAGKYTIHGSYVWF